MSPFSLILLVRLCDTIRSLHFKSRGPGNQKKPCTKQAEGLVTEEGPMEASLVPSVLPQGLSSLPGMVFGFTVSLLQSEFGFSTMQLFYNIK